MAKTEPITLGDDIQQKLLEAPTDALQAQSLKIHIDLRADGSTSRKLQARMGDNKELLGAIMDELARRDIDAGKLEVPFSHTMQSLFDKKHKGEP